MVIALDLVFHENWYIFGQLAPPDLVLEQRNSATKHTYSHEADHRITHEYTLTALMKLSLGIRNMRAACCIYVVDRNPVENIEERNDARICLRCGPGQFAWMRNVS
jgi:hypothetical protein